MSSYGRSKRQVLQPPVEPKQYTSRQFAELCTVLGVTQSMGAVGSSADNALAESFNATLKRELLQGAAAWPDELSCRRDIFRWATRYNTRRRHSWCGQQAPNAYEQQHTATLPNAAQSPSACPRSRGKAPKPRWDYAAGRMASKAAQK